MVSIKTLFSLVPFASEAFFFCCFPFVSEAFFFLLSSEAFFF